MQRYQKRISGPLMDRIDIHLDVQRVPSKPNAFPRWVSLMHAAEHQMDLSTRSYHRMLKLARTIADLAGEERMLTQYLAEALPYRPREFM